MSTLRELSPAYREEAIKLRVALEETEADVKITSKTALTVKPGEEITVTLVKSSGEKWASEKYTVTASSDETKVTDTTATAEPDGTKMEVTIKVPEVTIDGTVTLTWKSAT